MNSDKPPLLPPGSKRSDEDGEGMGHLLSTEAPLAPGVLQQASHTVVLAVGVLAGLLVGVLVTLAAGGSSAAQCGASAEGQKLVVGGEVLAPGTHFLPLNVGEHAHVFSNPHDKHARHEYSVHKLALPVQPGEQLHEVFYHHQTHTCFVSLAKSSTIMQVALNEDGAMSTVIRSWTVGHPEHNPDPTKAGLHNVHGSHLHPGMLWISTETDDRVYLVDPQDGFRVVYALHVPTAMVQGGVLHHIGGPHSVREDPFTHCLWVALKGSNTDEPQYNDPAHEAAYEAARAQSFLAEGETPPDSWAVWNICPDAYDESKFPAKGGKLYYALESPTMSAVDGKGVSWHTQDRVGTVLRIGPDGTDSQVFMPGHDPSIKFSDGVGPAITTAPDGSVWIATLASGGPGLVRFRPGAYTGELFTNLFTERQGARSVIQVMFTHAGGPDGDANHMYALTSSLLDPTAPEVLIVQPFNEAWNASTGKPYEVPISTSNAALHRLDIIHDRPPHSAVISGLLTNTLYQVQFERV